MPPRSSKPEPRPLSARREMFRGETREQIKQLAKAQLAESGDAGTLSLRSIARDLGVTAAALYSYFPAKDDIITALIVDTFNALAVRLDSVSPRRSPKHRLVDIAADYRRWAIAEPAEFRLLFGSPLAGYSAPVGGPTVEAVTRFSDVLLTAVIAVDPAGAPSKSGTSPSSSRSEGWGPFAPGFAAHAMALGATSASATSLIRYLGRIHGLVVLELGGFLSPMIPDPEPLFLNEVRAIVEEIAAQ